MSPLSVCPPSLSPFVSPSAGRPLARSIDGGDDGRETSGREERGAPPARRFLCVFCVFWRLRRADSPQPDGYHRRIARRRGPPLLFRIRERGGFVCRSDTRLHDVCVFILFPHYFCFTTSGIIVQKPCEAKTPKPCRAVRPKAYLLNGRVYDASEKKRQRETDPDQRKEKLGRI